MFEIVPRKITPMIKEVKVDGFALNSASEGEEVKIIQNSLITSLDEIFEHTANQIISMTIGSDDKDKINKLLVLIKPDNTAFIYTDYQYRIMLRAKRAIKKGSFVFDNDLVDIEGISFDLDDFSFDYQKGDKVIWLFRLNWKFGLYFNLTKESTKDQIYQEMGIAYKILKYYNLITFMENDKNFELLIGDGWFPFIELMGQGYKQLLGYYTEHKKYEFKIDKLLNSYSEERIKQLTDKWWRNKLYAEKKEIIEAGVKSYFLNTKDGYINCIKNLATEIEGIMRLQYIERNRTSPKTKEMTEFVINTAKEKLGINYSLSFPDLFRKYLDEVLFKKFDAVTGDIPASRHTFAHGVAKDNQYTRIKAFQIILSLDQLFYYLR